jgi:hypothetical protein
MTLVPLEQEREGVPVAIEDTLDDLCVVLVYGHSTLYR